MQANQRPLSFHIGQASQASTDLTAAYLGEFATSKHIYASLVDAKCLYQMHIQASRSAILQNALDKQQRNQINISKYGANV